MEGYGIDVNQKKWVGEPSPDPLNPFGSNCALTVQKALEAAGKNPGNPTKFNLFGNRDPNASIVDMYLRSKIPTYIYNNIKSQNSGFVIKTNRK